MEQQCVVCVRHVDDAAGLLDPEAGGYFLFGFATESATELWIHFRCLQRNVDRTTGDDG